MKYTIISIDDSRAEHKAKIRKEMAGVEEVFVECLDARPPEVDLDAELAKHGLKFADHWKNMQWKRGDIGGYVSHFNAWEWSAVNKEELLVFEDDAILPDGFLGNVTDLMGEVPDDYGVVALCVNDYNLHFYNSVIKYNKWGQPDIRRRLLKGEKNKHDYGQPRMVRAYNSWTMTATLYSPTGAASLVESSRRLGVHMNADAYVFHRAHCGDFDAYAPKPEYLHMVAQFNWGHSLIQSAEA